MARIRNQITYEINAEPQDFLNDMRRVNQSWDKTQANLREGARATVSTMGGAAGAAGAARGGLGSALGGAGLMGMAKNALPMLGVAGGVMAVTQLSRSMMNANQQMGKWRRQFQLLYGDAEQANEVLEDTIDFANATILDTGQVVQARTQLKYLGLDSNRYLTALADTAQMTGISINSITEALGRVQAGDPSQAMRMFRRFGIGNQQLAAAGVQFDGDKITSSAEQVLEGIVSAMEEKFGGTTESMSETMESAIGTLKNEWMRAMDEMAQVVLPIMIPVVEFITNAFRGIRAVTQGGRELFSDIGNVLSSVDSYFTQPQGGGTVQNITINAPVGVAMQSGLALGAGA